MPKPHAASAAVRRALRKVGADIREARRRRRLTMSVIADRAFTSRMTLQRIEAGDPSVGIGIYAAVLQALGLLDGLGRGIEASADGVGQALISAELPKRIRLRKPGSKSVDG
jgi:transcriptional regulator with XRE-family HTH domain